MALTASLLLLADARLPAGGHAHSGGVEAAVAAGLVTEPAELALFLEGRLWTAGLTAAACSAAACELTLTDGSGDVWHRLDAEVEARIPSPAQRATSRAQGRALRRVGRLAWPHDVLNRLGDSPHHPCVLGALTAVAGGTPREAGLVTAQAAATGPAWAALRLLSLDPFAVQAILTGLTSSMDAVAAVASAAAHAVGRRYADLPARAAPLLDLYAESHAHAEVRLFAS